MIKDFHKINAISNRNPSGTLLYVTRLNATYETTVTYRALENAFNEIQSAIKRGFIDEEFRFTLCDEIHEQLTKLRHKIEEHSKILNIQIDKTWLRLRELEALALN